MTGTTPLPIKPDTNKWPRLEVGRIIRALEAHIATLKQVKPGDPEYGNAYWEVLQLQQQVEALKYRPTVEQVAGWGGNWLGIIRSWMQWNCRNGSDVTWGSHDTLHLTSSLTPFNLENLAARIAQAAVIEHLGTYAVRRTEGGTDAPPTS